VKLRTIFYHTKNKTKIPDNIALLSYFVNKISPLKKLSGLIAFQRWESFTLALEKLRSVGDRLSCSTLGTPEFCFHQAKIP